MESPEHRDRARDQTPVQRVTQRPQAARGHKPSLCWTRPSPMAWNVLDPQAVLARRREARNLAPSGLGSKVFAWLGKAGQADGWGQLQASLPAGQGSLVTLGPRRPHPSRPTQAPSPSCDSPNPPAGFFPTLRAVGCIFRIPGHCSFLLKFLAPRPIPPWERASTAPTHALSWAAWGRSSWPAGSCEVRGCQGEEPRLGGRHGKAARECYPEPLLLAAPFRSLCAERQMGLPAGTTVSCWPWALPGMSICLG